MNTAEELQNSETPSLTDENPNGGQTMKIEVVDDEGNNTTIDPEPIKEPIFIGGMLTPQLLEEIEKLIPTTHELAVLSPVIQEKCKQTYFYQKLGDRERDNVIKLQQDKNSRAEALAAITEIEMMFVKDLGLQPDFDRTKNAISFNYKDLKATINLHRRTELSNRRLQELVDLLIIHGFLTPTIHGANFIKQVWAITIDPVSRLQSLQIAKESVLENQKMNELTIQEYDKEISKVSMQINNVGGLSLDASREDDMLVAANTVDMNNINDDKSSQGSDERMFTADTLSKKEQEIINVLTAHGDVVTTGDICSEVNSSDISKQLNRLVNLELIEKVSRGNYKIKTKTV